VSFAAAIGALSGRSVELTTLVDPTMTTTTLLQRVMSSETWRSTIAGADVITITVGGNDADPFGSYPIGTCAPGGKPAACLLAYAPALEPNLDAILAEIGKLRSGRPTAIRVTNPDFNPFIGLEPGRDLPPFAPDFGVSFYRQVADGELAVVCAVAERHGAQCVDFYHAFNGPDGTADAAPFLTSDHLHPSKVGQDRIAELLGAAGLAPLLPDAT
jgi:lysophospholipase L1-like esterase